MVLDVRERAAVRRPNAVSLVGFGRRKRARFASRAGDAPVVDPSGAVGREHHRGSIRRDQRIAERPSFPVVEEVLVLDNHPFLTPVGRNLDDGVVHPLVIESHEEDKARIRAPGRVDLQFGAIRQSPCLAGGDCHRPHVILSVAVSGKCDPTSVRRPGIALDQPAAVARDSHLFAVPRRPEPDLRRAALVRHVGDPTPVRRPAGFGRGEKVTASPRRNRKFADGAALWTNQAQVRAAQKDPVAAGCPARGLAADRGGERQECFRRKRAGSRPVPATAPAASKMSGRGIAAAGRFSACSRRVVAWPDSRKGKIESVRARIADRMDQNLQVM